MTKIAMSKRILDHSFPDLLQVQFTGCGYTTNCSLYDNGIDDCCPLPNLAALSMFKNENLLNDYKTSIFFTLCKYLRWPLICSTPYVCCDIICRFSNSTANQSLQQTLFCYPLLLLLSTIKAIENQIASHLPTVGSFPWFRFLLND